MPRFGSLPGISGLGCSCLLLDCLVKERNPFLGSSYGSGQGLTRQVRVMETIGVFGSPELPEHVGLFVFLPGFNQHTLGHARPFGDSVSVNQLAEPVFGLAHLASRVVLDGLDLIEFLLGGGFRMAAEAGLLDVVPGPDHAVV